MTKILLILSFLAACTAYAQVPGETHSKIESLINQFPQEKSVVKGEVLYLLGQVRNTEGRPIQDASVEIWQTDDGGSYDHPNDRETKRRDKSFQFFGKTSTDEYGWYVFRTLLPGEYDPRPKHIHLKIKLKDHTLLTSQFYFTNDRKHLESWTHLEDDRSFQQTLTLQLFNYSDALVARGNIYISDSTQSSRFSSTPSQAEGPYYPVKSFEDKDNDLIG